MIMQNHYPSLWALLGAWLTLELSEAADVANGDRESRVTRALELLDELVYHLPRFGSPEAQWVMAVDNGTTYGTDFVQSNVCQFYAVDANRVQFLCALGRVTVKQL